MDTTTVHHPTTREQRGLELYREHQDEIAATIARSKTAACSGCCGRCPHRDLVEATEDDLGVFEGERFCGPCAARVGVA